MKLHYTNYANKNICIISKYLEVKGIEPPTFHMLYDYSTTELYPHTNDIGEI